MPIVRKTLSALCIAAAFAAAPAVAAEPTAPGTARAKMQATEQKLSLGLSAPTKPFVVREGETLQAVALRLGTDVGVLAQLNNLARPFNVRPGQVLLAPSGGVASMLAAPIVNPQALVPKPTVAKAGGPAVAPRASGPRGVQTASAANRSRPLPPGVSELDLLPLSQRPGATDPKPAAPVARAKVEREVLR
jgi:LysM repeat protein